MALDDKAAREAIRTWIAQQHEALDRGSYYTLLGVQRTATEAEIRTAYYYMVARFHPDLYGDQALEPETRAKLISLYSRLVEGYHVLSDGVKRGQYDKGLAQGKLRWSLEEERTPRKDAEADIANPSARRLYKMGKAALMAGDARQAIMNLKMALSTEPDNVLLRAELARAEALAAPKGKP